MSDKIEPIRLCWVLRRNFMCLSQSDSWTQPCHVGIPFIMRTTLLANVFRYNVSLWCYDLSLR